MTRHPIAALAVMVGLGILAHGQGAPGGAGRGGPEQTPAVTGPWSCAKKSPDERAGLLLKEMTLDEKITLVHGAGRGFGAQQGPAPAGPAVSNGGAGFTQSIPRLGTPAIQMADASVGVALGAASSRYSTALPDTLAAASSRDPKLACEYGALIGQELRDQGYTMSLGGGVNLMREPRNGRLFEYMGEDPIPAGILLGNEMKCPQAKGIIGDIKHYALNDQETGRNSGRLLPHSSAFGNGQVIRKARVVVIWVLAARANI